MERMFHHRLWAAVLIAAVVSCDEGAQSVTRETGERNALLPHDALVAEYLEAAPIPTGPWKGIGDGSEVRAALVGRELELLGILREDPSPGIYCALGILYTQAGEPTRGMSFLAKSLELDASKGLAWSWLGANRLSFGEFETAALLLEHAVSIDPTDALAFKYLGIARGRCDDVVGAKSAFEEAIRLDPNASDARVELASHLEDEGLASEAYAHLLDANRVRPDDDTTLFRLARIARELGHEEKAREFEFQHERLRVLEDLGYLKESVTNARRSITLGIYFLGKGRVVEALPEFDNVLASDPSPAERENALLGTLSLFGGVEALRGS